MFSSNDALHIGCFEENSPRSSAAWWGAEKFPDWKASEAAVRQEVALSLKANRVTIARKLNFM